MKEYQDFTWKGNRLYEQEILWSTIIPVKEHPGMWRINWAGDGSLSMDMFNKTRAKDNAQKMACFLSNKMREIASEKPASAKI